MARVSAAVREKVRLRAKKRCEYCCKPEKYSPFSFHCDHIIPIKKHGGTPDDSNLAWACLDCNVNKGSDIASYDEQTKELTPLFNPRTQQWEDHFELDSLGLMNGKTSVGRVTIRVLDMNEDRRVETRASIIKKGNWKTKDE